MESNSKNPSITRYYKDYFKISAEVIERTKLLEYDKQILKSRIDNENNGTDYFNYFIKHAFKKSISKNEL